MVKVKSRNNAYFTYAMLTYHTLAHHTKSLSAIARKFVGDGFFDGRLLI